MTPEVRRYRNALPKALSLTRSDWWSVARAQVALIRAQRTLRDRPTGELAADDVSAAPVPEIDRSADARRIALAVSRAATYGLFRPRCLARSLALRQMLREEGIDEARVRVGVQLRKGRFVAHAWVEYNGHVIGDDPSTVARFAPLGVTVAEL